MRRSFWTSDIQKYRQSHIDSRYELIGAFRDVKVQLLSGITEVASPGQGLLDPGAAAGVESSLRKEAAMFEDVDLLVCGAGPAGCVLAERAAHVLGWKVLVVERRSHIAGNCHDSQHASGLLVHDYGPHYFRTNNDA